MKRSEVKSNIAEHLTGLIMNGDLRPDAAPDLILFINESIETRDQSIIEDIALLVRQWEHAMGEEDKTLYTLGLRRIIDLIREDNYLPMSKEDFREFKRPFDLPERPDKDETV